MKGVVDEKRIVGLGERTSLAAENYKKLGL